MEFFAKIVNDFQPFNKFVESFILDVWLGSQYAFDVPVMEISQLAFPINGLKLRTK